MKLNGTLCTCKNQYLTKIFSYEKKPKKEKNFDIDKKYRRAFYQCNICDHIYSKLNFELKNIYKSDYFEKTYKDINGVKKRFNYVNKLKLKNSDNKNRVLRINRYFQNKKDLSVLDVGSGIGIFLYEMKKKNWHCNGLEMDERYAFFSNKYLKIKVQNKKLQNFKTKKKYDLISFNKVLEHVPNPANLLKCAKSFLKNNGVIYIEVPDGKVKKLGKFRDEFCVDHLHLFSLASISILSTKAGFNTELTKRIIDPSGKYTIYSFLKKK
tara:strand:+ start:2004 stop:2804 length:801 start_codon:yes stop_codon:yes gene_type:complete